ncbi:MAG: Hsp33 family molecular chaperone HslO [Sandaracinaceae bacterium]|nr:Hsp33 family molecular chaperone HslO [Sandaracinaceae bacterium]
MPVASTSDRTTTAVTHDGAFRVIALRTTETVRGCVRAQGAEGEDARHLADVVTGTILVRLTMAPTQRVQGIVRDADGATLVGDSHPDGSARGLVQRKEGARISLGRGAMMQMMRTLPSGAVHQGVVEVPDASVSAGIMAYLSISEQITSVAMVTSQLEGDEIVCAGGYVVQLLPEVSRAPLAVMTERLDADFSTPEAVLGHLADDPATLMSEILYGMKFAQTQEASLRFGCQCSAVRVLSSLSTLPKDDIRELMSSEEHLHITCDYCRQVYELPPKALAGLLSES